MVLNIQMLSNNPSTTFLQYLDNIKKISIELTAYITDTIEVVSIKKCKELNTCEIVAGNIYFVGSGILRAYLPASDTTEETTTRIMTSGDFVFVSSTKEINSELFQYIETVSDCIVIKISMEKRERMISEFPELNFHYRKIAQLYADEIALKEYVLRQKTATRRVELFRKHFGELEQLVPIKYLASLINVHRCTFTEIKNKHYRKSGGGG